MRRLLITASFLLALLVPSLAQAATRYIDDAGSNANAGTSTGVPWLTFAHAMTNTACGDTLIVMDGAYTTATHGSLNITKSCTVNTVFLVQAQNQRAARLQGDGSLDVLKISTSAYVTVDGLRITSADNNSISSGFHPANVLVNSTSNHIVLRNLLVSHNNRYRNTQLMFVDNATNNLIEDVELYSWHRHGISFGVGANSNVVRRVYGNSRAYVDVVGGFPSGDATKGDAAFADYGGNANIYENCISEGQVTGFDVEATPGVDNKFYGDISLSDNFGFLIKARGATFALQPQNTIITNSAVVTPLQIGIYLRSNYNTQCTNCTVWDTGNNYGFIIEDEAFAVASSGHGTNVLVVSATTGIYIDPSIGTWTMTNTNAFSNSVANYNPATHANYNPSDTPSAVDPVMGTCRVWIPDASPMKGAGAGGADIGANILYRYADGVLTTVPLWDPTTGDFPRGATVAGVNDVAGSSLFDVDARLNVNTGGCLFPASYAGATPPENPAAYISSTGTTSTTHNHTIDAGMDLFVVCVALLDNEANVGSVSSITSGGEALTLLAPQPVSSPAYRRVAVGYKLAPTSGLRSVVVSTTGDVDATVSTSMEIDGISAIGSSATATNQSATPSVTVPTNTSETIIDCLSAYSGTSLTAGQHQTLQMDTAHGSIAQRGATSTQSGNDGGGMGHTLGIAGSWWVVEAVAFLPTTPDSPPSPTPVLNQTKFRWHGLYGTEAGPDVKPYAAAPNSTNITAHPTGMARLRIEITADDNTSTSVGLVLNCRKNADGYTPALDTFNSKVFRLLGPGIVNEVPGSLTATTQQLSVGNYVAGAMLRSEPAVFTTPSLTTGKHTEMEWVLVLNATAGDTIDCRVHRDDGTAINTYTATPRITIAPLAAGY